ncbi:MAG: hypothetical protein RI897_2725 [Verrucomicrobiota bacterium]
MAVDLAVGLDARDPVYERKGPKMVLHGGGDGVDRLVGLGCAGFAGGGALLADDEFTERLDGEEAGDVGDAEGGFEAVGGDFAQEGFEAFEAGIGDGAAFLEVGFREVAAGFLDDFAAGDLHLEEALEPEDDIDEVDGLGTEVVDEGGVEFDFFGFAADGVGDGFGYFGEDGLDFFGFDFDFAHADLLHFKAAVDVQDFSGDIVGPLGGEERDCVGDIFGFTVASEQDSAEDLVTGAFADVAGHFSFDDPGCDGIDRDTAGCQFDGEGFGEGVDGAFTGGVGGLAASAFFAGDGADIDDFSAALGDEVGGGGAGHIEDAGDVGIEDGLDIVVFEEGERVVADDPGVIDEDVELACAVDDFFDEGGALGGVSDVDFFGGDVGIGVGGDDGLGGLLIGEVGEGDVGAGVGEGFDDGAADAAATAGDDHGFSGEAGVMESWVAHPEMQYPPSTTKVWPVIMAASGRQSKYTASAT